MKLKELINQPKKKAVNEAEQIDFDTLDIKRKKQVIVFETIFGGKSEIWEGIHGYIAYIKAPGIGGKYRFSDNIMKKLLDAKARWVEAGGGTVSVGF